MSNAGAVILWPFFRFSSSALRLVITDSTTLSPTLTVIRALFLNRNPPFEKVAARPDPGQRGGRRSHESANTAAKPTCRKSGGQSSNDEIGGI